MKRHYYILLSLFIFCTITTGCRKEIGNVPEPCPSVYYWQTQLALDSTERAYLRQHEVGKIYVKFFDVALRDGKAMPVGTLQFRDSIPAGIKVIPTVFITEECLHADTASLGEKIATRVKKMTDSEHVPNVSEVQIDCDWTPRSRDTYFALLEDIRTRLKAFGWGMSVTIRLHQLQQATPPADYGVLMVYNTGNLKVRSDHNPILDMRDVEPFLKHLRNYDLPLCAAYPNYRWQLLFSGKDFKGILYDENLADSTVYARISGDTLYQVIQARTLHGAMTADYDIHIVPGQEVRVWECSEADVKAIADKLEEVRPGINAQTIIYHLGAVSKK